MSEVHVLLVSLLIAENFFTVSTEYGLSFPNMSLKVLFICEGLFAYWTGELLVRGINMSTTKFSSAEIFITHLAPINRASILKKMLP